MKKRFRLQIRSSRPGEFYKPYFCALAAARLYTSVSSRTPITMMSMEGIRDSNSFQFHLIISFEICLCDSKTEYAVTNAHAVAATSVKIEKKWDDANSELRPESIRLHLFADGEEIKTAELTADADGNWSYDGFTDLPAYKNGQKIVYSATEEVVKGYVLKSSSSEIQDGKTIVNLINKKIDFEINKADSETGKLVSGASMAVYDITDGEELVKSWTAQRSRSLIRTEGWSASGSRRQARAMTSDRF